ncbi:TonB-dependent receptor [Flavobacterium undicola]|uniref:TonB-dependent receptor n=1 Tax=Flavobacterium undicola TaxID=1932779 RepID=UPI0013766423|nr:TonB-dependent receptor [Flavobacterium undicola]MBA0883560.1 TonB-dependent receptor [Flavobacterium undicola]
MKKTVVKQRLLIRLMKMTLYQFVLALIFSTVTMANSLNGQGKLDTKVTISISDVNLNKALTELGKSANVKFSYNSRMVSFDQKVTVKAENEVLSAVLSRILKPLNITYTVVSNQIILQKTTAISEDNVTASVNEAQQKVLSGVVVDVKGLSLPGASVLVKGTSNSTSTDMDGKFSIRVDDAAKVLVVSFIGFDTMEIPIGNKTDFKITLRESSQALQEVVVIGYGSQKKTDLTGAVTTVKAKDINGIRGGNAAEALQGKSGLTVVSSGSPGASPVVRIRGIGTNSDSSPLYVVDGMMTNDVTWLNPKDIESMSVLKDASATAIYGSRGANGVIMVTTKKGKSGKSVISYSGSIGSQFVLDNYKLANGSEYATLMNTVASTAGQTQPYSNPSQYGQGTNWMDEISRTGLMSDHQVSASGGTENVNYNISLGYFEQKGVWNNTNYNRWTLRINNDYKLNSQIKIGHNFNISNANTGQALTYRTVRSVLSGSPLIIPKNNQGAWNPMQNNDLINPAAELELNKDANTNDLRFVGDLWGSWDIIDGLQFKTSFGEDWMFTRFDQFLPQYSINPSFQFNNPNSYTENYSTNNTWLWTNTLTYDKKINESNRLNLLVGQSSEATQFRGLGATGKKYAVDNLDYASIYSASLNNRTVNVFLPTKSSRASFWFRTNYALKDRYLFTATIRADGSSKFGPNNKWGYFPSAALGWRISEESFLKQLSWLNNLKIRGSWGMTGNDKIFNNVAYALVTQSDEFHAVFNGQLNPAAGIVNDYNPNVKWENNIQADLGLEMSALDNRLTFEFDYFNRKTEDLLMILPIQGGSVGIAPTYSNAGSVQNKGYEVMIGWQDNKNNFKYGVNFTGSSFKNEVVDWNGLTTTNTTFSTNLQTRIKEGQPFNYFYGYKTQGIYRTQADVDSWNAYAVSKGKTAYHTAAKLGDMIYVDTNGDGQITPDDQTNIGNPFPKFTGSIALNAEYKNFDFSLDFMGSFGAKVMNNSYNDFTSPNNNMHTDWLDSWTPTNTGATMPRLAAGSVNMNRTIDIMVFNGNYVKLRNATLGYTLPDSVTEKIGISKLRFYLTGANLLYFTKYKGFTPELADGLDYNSFPISGSMQFGMNLNF